MILVTRIICYVGLATAITFLIVVSHPHVFHAEEAVATPYSLPPVPRRIPSAPAAS